MKFDITEYKSMLPKDSSNQAFEYIKDIIQRGSAKIQIIDELGVTVTIPFYNIEISASANDYPQLTVEGYGPLDIQYPEGVRSKWN